jgi:hypothetical protein
MLFDPDATLDDVECNLAFLERHADLPWNVCRTEVYPGTHLFARLSAEGRLFGDFRSYGYRMKHSEAELLFRILRVSLNERALATTSLHNRLISLAFAWQLHQTLFSDESTIAIAEEARLLGQAVRRDTVNRIHRAVDWVREHSRVFSNGGNSEDRSFGEKVSQFAVAEGRSIGLFDFPNHQRAERLWDLLHARGKHLVHSNLVKLREYRDAGLQIS